MLRARHVLAWMMIGFLGLFGLSSIILAKAPPGTEAASIAASARAPADQVIQFTTQGHGALAAAAFLLLVVVTILLFTQIHHRCWQALRKWENGSLRRLRLAFATNPVSSFIADFKTRRVLHDGTFGAILSFWPGTAGGLGSHLGKYGVPHPC